ncbi:MAG: aminomethyl-transferring glycine dehydrogenase subunit GcvPA [Fimbriimonadaceae bacterium]|nr:aminomethyl-transferring glycine dehydrogenase subunit GcvPA [Fimbriimonadaceae bacterium]
MHPYIPHTDADRDEMLEVIGAKSIEELFAAIPPELRIQGDLNVPEGLDEHRLLAHVFGLSRKNKSLLTDLVCFLGAGIYDRYIPATIGAILSRGEFLTAYTPYQPELSQGYLQTIYEFQTMVAELYGMEVANASMYDGSTAMAEAAILAHGVTGRDRVLIAESVHPHYREVMRTYGWSAGLEIVEAPIDMRRGRIDIGALSSTDSNPACIVVQSPNFLGGIEDLAELGAIAKDAGALFIVVADPISCALLPPPAEFGADIVVGEGQPLGIAMGFGGPALGLFACKAEHVRRIPGRIVGRTEDHDGNPGFVMTLRTREQDIRREKATSNICTNQALMALAATVYMSALGKNGMRKVAESTVRSTQYAIERLCRAGGKLRFETKVFGEFVLELPKDATEVQEALLDKGILAGLPLGPIKPELTNCLLVAVTETRTRREIDQYADRLAEALA